jgi:hypothetical protein
MLDEIDNHLIIVNEGPGDQKEKERTEAEDFLLTFLNKNEVDAP